MQKAPLTPELSCSNLKESLRFYIDILGFKIAYDRPEEYFSMLDYQGARLMLEQPSKETRTWLSAELEKPYGRGVNFQIKTSDVDQLYKNTKDNNCNIFLDIEEKWYRANDKEVGNKQFIITDPDGYLLRFFEDLGERPIQKTLD